MFDSLIRNLLFPANPKFPNAREAPYEELFDDGLTMGTAIFGKQGTGKTTVLARHIVEYFKKYPDRAIFVLDWSGPISNEVLKLLLQEKSEVVKQIPQRVVYDALGHSEWVIPMPEFSHLYGSSDEELAQRVSLNLAKLAPELVKDAPLLAGLGLREIGPQLFRVITAISNDQNITWQVTEAKKLLTDKELLKRALDKYGDKVPEAKWYFEKMFLKLKPAERELRTYALLSMLGTIEAPETRARVGSYRPGWTPKEAIENGLLVLVDGSRLINQRNTQHYLFTQVYSLIMNEINKRQPGNPNDRPVALVMDEVYSLLSIPGMAEEVGMLAPLYRSRKLELYIVLQALSQLAPILKEQIWSIGNVVSFAVSNFKEAYDIAQQLFPYVPTTIKIAAKSDTQQPIIEPDRGQYLKIANDIQNMGHRECVIRRYISEKEIDKYIRWVKKTKDVKNAPTDITVEDLKEHLLKRRGVRVRDALDVINRRTEEKKVSDSPSKKVSKSPSEKESDSPPQV
jgi:hypothetical protein